MARSVRRGRRGASSGGESRNLSGLLGWLDRHANQLLDDPNGNLVAIGIGKKSAGPIDDGSSFCITGFVKEKLTKTVAADRGVQLFSAAVATAADVATPEALDLVIDVVEAGSAFRARPGLSAPTPQRGLHGGLPPTVDFQKRFDALRSGLGITNPHRRYPSSLSVGTLGFFVRDDKGAVHLVSNNHVIADENDGKIGDGVVQPGTLDLTRSELSLMPTIPALLAQLKIASLSAVVDIQFHGPAGIPFNSVDCAAAKLHDGSGRDVGEVARVGFGGRLAGIAAPFALDPASGALVGSPLVYKAGRTTGWTEGNVTNIAVSTNVQYGKGFARFRNQIAVTASADNDGPFSRSGDSGSGVVNAGQQLVGLLFAGSEQQTLVNPIDEVMSALKTAMGASTLDLVT